MRDDVRLLKMLPTLGESLSLLGEIAKTQPYQPPSVVDRPVYLYGAGNLGRLAWTYFKKVGVKVDGVFDQNAEQHKKNPFWDEACLMHPSEATEKMRRDALLAVCVVTSSWASVTKPLREAGWQNYMPFYTLCIPYTDIHPLDNGWLSGPLSQEDQDGISSVLGAFSDGISRAHFLQFIAWHSLLEEWDFSEAPVHIEDRYFIPEVLSLVHDHEDFLDLGGHHGEVVTRFLGVVHHAFSSIVSVEPDQANVKVLRQTVASLPAEVSAKIKIEEKVLGEKAGPGRFISGIDYASRLVDKGGDEVQVETLDSMTLSPTFIKAHLEGGELGALLGGLVTVRRTKPIIALTVYHNRLGLWVAARRLIEEMGGDSYRYLFRLHGWHGSGAVLYILPKKR